MRFGFVGPSYTVASTSIADEECINLYAQTVESQGAIVPTSAYGGKNAQGLRSYFGTPGLAVFAAFSGPSVANTIRTPQGRVFVVSGDQFSELFSNGTFNVVQSIASDANPASLACNGPQILIVYAGHAYCFTLATGAILEVTGQLAGIPVKVQYSDSFFIVSFQNSNEFQMSQVLDGTTWPGQLVNEVSVFSDQIVSIAVNHRELWVFGQNHAQPYQDTGSAEIFDVIPGALIESGIASPFCVDRLDNSLFWISNDERGGRMAWRSNGYTPTRVSTYAVETDLNSYPSVDGMVSYSYQDRGHLFWVIYVPGAQWSWCYDVVESLWHKRAFWNAATNSWQAHFSWNHVYAFGQHLVGDWNSGNLYTMSANNFMDNGQTKRWLRRTPAILSEMERVFHRELTIDFDMGNLNTVAPSDLPNFAPSLFGPNAGTVAVDVNNGTASWQSPGNALLPGVYTSANLQGTSYQVASVEAFESKLGEALGPENYFVLVTFTGNVPPIPNTYDFTGLTSYPTLNGTTPTSIAGGGAYLPVPGAMQALFELGTTAIPLRYVVTGSVTGGTFVANEAVAQAGTGATSALIGAPLGSASMYLHEIIGSPNNSGVWIGQTSNANYSPTSVPVFATIADTGSATVPSIVQYSDALWVSGFPFAIPASNTPDGIIYGILAYATVDGASLIVQSLKAGGAFPNVGTILTLPISANPTILYFGTSQSLWGVDWAAADINNAAFGVSIQASASSGLGVSVFVGLVQIQVYAPPTMPNYSYIGPPPVLLDGNGNPRPPQCMIRFSDTRGKTWSNENIVSLGAQGDYTARAKLNRLGVSRYRLYEASGSDPIPWAIVDAYLKTSPSTATP
jgi:hypothetical protein